MSEKLSFPDLLDVSEHSEPSELSELSGSIAWLRVGEGELKIESVE